MEVEYYNMFYVNEGQRGIREVMKVEQYILEQPVKLMFSPQLIILVFRQFSSITVKHKAPKVILTNHIS